MNLIEILIIYRMSIWVVYDIKLVGNIFHCSGGCTGSSESIHVKMQHCWKSHVRAHLKKYLFLHLYIQLDNFSQPRYQETKPYTDESY